MIIIIILLIQVENSLSTYEPHACVVVYSIVDRNSFRVAEEILNYLWQEKYTKEKAVIIAANKSDLARSRVINTSGKVPNLELHMYKVVTYACPSATDCLHK